MASAAALINLMIGGIIAIFGSLHFILLLKNKTTLECMYCDLGRPTYNMGFKENFKEVMGNNCLLWAFPTGGGTRLSGKLISKIEFV